MAGDWPAVSQSLVQHATATDLTIQLAGLVCQDGSHPSLAYLWRQTPVQAPLWGVPVYSDIGYILPAGPWIVQSKDIPYKI